MSNTEQKRNYYLINNFAPVNTEVVEPANVSFGRIPSDLHGEYVRNGPNPQFDFLTEKKPYHWSDHQFL